jgi:RND family efflux transporter MFP subunit
MSLPENSPASSAKRRTFLSVSSTAFAAIAAAFGCWAIWSIYMQAPWTRDGTVRAYVVSVTPQVSGRIAQLAVQADQFVKKGDLLMIVEPDDYQITVQSAEAAVSLAKIDLDNKQADAARFTKLNGLAISQEAEQTALATASMAAATYQQARASLSKARLDLQRTQIFAPVDGYVTNLAIQPGDYATAGQRALSVVDTASFWVDAYFEETLVGKIKDHDKATVKLMSYPGILHGRVAGVGRGISVANATTDSSGLATVNPVFTWVRLAQRIPVRIELDPSLSPQIRLSVGMTATVSIDM